MKKLCYIFTFLMIIFSLTFNSSFAEEKTFVVDGKNVSLTTTQIKLNDNALNCDVPPVILSGRTLVPIRVISENLGAKIDWDAKNYKATIKKDSKTMVLKINSYTVSVNGKNKTLPDKVAAKLISGRTMVPLRFISEELGLKVNWDDKNKIVNLASDTNNSNQNNNNTNVEEPKINNFADFKFAMADDKESFTISRDLKTEYKSFYMSNPSKLVFDIYNVSLKDGKTSKTENINKNYIKSYNSYYYKAEGRTRVTIVFKDGVDKNNIKISENGSNIYVLFDIPKPVDNNTNGNETDTNKDIDNNTNNNNNTNNSSKLDADGNGRYFVTIDAGHGGSDTGAISSIDKTKEKDLTLSISKKLEDKLKQSGYDTIMTRNEDVYPTLADRYNLANNNKTDIFVSVHINSASPSATGIETLYYPNEGEAAKGRDNEMLAKIVQEEIINETSAVNRKIVKRPNLAVLKGTNMPAILVECGFLSNSDELNLMNSDEYQEKLANGILKGIQRYFNEIKK